MASDAPMVRPINTRGNRRRKKSVRENGSDSRLEKSIFWLPTNNATAVEAANTSVRIAMARNSFALICRSQPSSTPSSVNPNDGLIPDAFGAHLGIVINLRQQSALQDLIGAPLRGQLAAAERQYAVE